MSDLPQPSPLGVWRLSPGSRGRSLSGRSRWRRCRRSRRRHSRLRRWLSRALGRLWRRLVRATRRRRVAGRYRRRRRRIDRLRRRRVPCLVSVAVRPLSVPSRRVQARVSRHRADGWRRLVSNARMRVHDERRSHDASYGSANEDTSQHVIPNQLCSCDQPQMSNQMCPVIHTVKMQ